MTLREQLQEQEAALSPLACKSSQSRGRARPEEECAIRTPFQRDTDRIVYSKAFRRLKHKTQVFLQPEGDHYRTRMTHTLEVSRIARTMARALLLNEDLTEAIALGHDLGHTPFGHAGERLLNEVMPGGFAHYRQSVRVVERLEIVRLADHIAYINHDIEDALRAGIIYPMDIPLEISALLGFTHSARVNALVTDAVQASRGQAEIKQSPAVGEAMLALKHFMFASVYTNPVAKGEEGKAQDMLRQLFEYYQKYPDKLPSDFQAIRAEEGTDRAVCDYIAGMTDPFAVETFKELFLPKGWTVL